jgi:GNAT superfamily N-acetyltransferase
MLSVNPFEASHVPDAARLFADAYAQQCTENALLPPQFCDPSAIEPRLADMANEQPGAVLLDGEQLAGYLLSYVSIPGFFGRSAGVYVPIYGHSIAPEYEIGQVYPALYARLAAEWVQRGCGTHAITYFAGDGSRSQEMAALLSGYGFGLQVIDAIRPLAVEESMTAGAFTIKAAGDEDLDAIHTLDSKLGDHLRSAPIFLHTSPVPEQELFVHFLRDGTKTFLAWNQGVAVGGMRAVLNSGPGCELFNVPGSLGVNFAYTDEATRRNGVATHLLHALLQWGAQQGMERCVVDFESANLPARGFWETHFQPICHSAVRKVDDRTVSVG